jgi:hypothetical protein
MYEAADRADEQARSAETMYLTLKKVQLKHFYRCRGLFVSGNKLVLVSWLITDDLKLLAQRAGYGYRTKDAPI